MKVAGVKATGFSRVVGGLRMPEIEMTSGSECVSRRPEGIEYIVRLESTSGKDKLRLTLNESEMRDWHMRLSRALAQIDKERPDRDQHLGCGGSIVGGAGGMEQCARCNLVGSPLTRIGDLAR